MSPQNTPTDSNHGGNSGPYTSGNGGETLIDTLAQRNTWSRQEVEALRLIHDTENAPRVQLPAIKNILSGGHIGLSNLLIEYRDCCATFGGVLTIQDRERIRAFEALGKEANLLDPGFNTPLYEVTPDAAADISTAAKALGQADWLPDSVRKRRLSSLAETADREGLDITGDEVRAVCEYTREEQQSKTDTEPPEEHHDDDGRLKEVFDSLFRETDTALTSAQREPPGDTEGGDGTDDSLSEDSEPRRDDSHTSDDGNDTEAAEKSASWPRCAHEDSDGEQCPARVLVPGAVCPGHGSDSAKDRYLDPVDDGQTVAHSTAEFRARRDGPSLCEPIATRVDVDPAELSGDGVERAPAATSGGRGGGPEVEVSKYPPDNETVPAVRSPDPDRLESTDGVSPTPRTGFDSSPTTTAVRRAPRATDVDTISAVSVRPRDVPEQEPAIQTAPRPIEGRETIPAIRPRPRSVSFDTAESVVDRVPRPLTTEGLTPAVRLLPRPPASEEATPAVAPLPREVVFEQSEAAVRVVPREIPEELQTAITPVPREISAASEPAFERVPRDVTAEQSAITRLPWEVAPETTETAIRPLPRAVSEVAESAIRVLPRETGGLGEGVSGPPSPAFRPLPRSSDSERVRTPAFRPLPRPRPDADALSPAVRPLPRTRPEAVFTRSAVRQVSEDTVARPLADIYPNAGPEFLSPSREVESDAGVGGVATKSETDQLDDESGATDAPDTSDEETMVDASRDDSASEAPSNSEGEPSTPPADGTSVEESADGVTATDTAEGKSDGGEDSPAGLDGITLNGEWNISADEESGEQQAPQGDAESESAARSPDSGAAGAADTEGGEAPVGDEWSETAGDLAVSGDEDLEPLGDSLDVGDTDPSLLDMPTDDGVPAPGEVAVDPANLAEIEELTDGTEAALADLHQMESQLPQEYDPTNQRAFGTPNYLQDLLDFEYVFEEDDDYSVSDVDPGGMIAVDDDTYVGLIKVEPRRWSIHTREKKQQIYLSYMKSFCNTLQFPTEIVAFPTELELTEHIDEVEQTLREQGDSEDSSTLLNHGRAFYPEWLNAYVDASDMTRQEFFVIVPVNRDQIEQFRNDEGILATIGERIPPVEILLNALENDGDEDSATQTQCLRELDQRMSRLESALKQSGVSPERLEDRQEVLSVLYLAFNKEKPLSDEFGDSPITRVDPREAIAGESDTTPELSGADGVLLGETQENHD